MPVERIIVAAVTLTLVFTSPMTRVGLGLRSQQQMPVSYVCPMDADVLAETPGACPICKMDLQPTRIETAWSCPIHAVVMKDGPGQCELDHRDLVPVTINHSWVCPDSENDVAADPGKCADGRPRQERKVLRAHGDHNPRHGGQFFMAGDRWHHVEGTYPSATVFRLYVYDNFTNTLGARGIAGRIFSREENGRELDPIQLLPSKDGTTLEARIEGAAFPQTVTAKVMFKPGTPEHRFDFTFRELTRDSAVAPPRPPARPVATPDPPVRSVRAQAASTPSESVKPAPGPAAPSLAATPVHSETPWPGSIPDALTVLDIRAREILTLIDQGNLAVVYAPTMLAKDLALAVADHADELPAERRKAVILAVRRAVLAAWALDRFGDLGDRSKLVQAHSDFAQAVGDMKAAYAAR
jgi:hypothetical protein